MKDYLLSKLPSTPSWLSSKPSWPPSKPSWLPSKPSWFGGATRESEVPTSLVLENNRDHIKYEHSVHSHSRPEGGSPQPPPLPSEHCEVALLPPSEEGDDPSIRVFRNKLDRCSEKDVIQECQDLNEKISSTVLTIIDEWAQSRDASSLVHQSRSADAVNLEPECQKDLLFVLGRKTYDSIRHARSSPPSECKGRMFDALQAYTTYFTFRVISETFCPYLSPKTDDEMRQVFECMLASEPQATALRCQALIFTHAKHGVNTKETQANLQEKLFKSFNDIFVLAGGNTTSPFLQKMRHFIVKGGIVEAALWLSEMLKTCFFSAHFDVFFIRPSQPFDSRCMTTADSSRKADSLDTIPVLCTIELGIREIPSAQHSNPMAEDRVLLKPKVLVE
ncbi:hypothetical protein DFH11DRAFT_1699147 [Phellopilus nigrolimitatus]|nr:hypothetical protein DFH11DRAFT_1699147 [Phellopilus nigrolimitatus]